MRYLPLSLLLPLCSGCVQVLPFVQPVDEPKFPADYGLKVQWSKEF